jgi:hypothetical protein
MEWRAKVFALDQKKREHMPSRASALRVLKCKSASVMAVTQLSLNQFALG